MSDDRTPRIERILELTARKVSGGGLHPLEILQQVSEAVEREVRDGVAPNDISLGLHPSDYRKYQPSLANLRAEIELLLDEQEREHRWRRIGERSVAIASSPVAGEGAPQVSARFTDTSHRFAAVPEGATRRITRHRNVVLALSDGTRVPLSHTPFSIGRGPGNDLVIASLEVSRKHAEIVKTEEGLVIHDLGSRNGVLLDGLAHPWIALRPGVVVSIGELQLWLERAV